MEGNSQVPDNENLERDHQIQRDDDDSNIQEKQEYSCICAHFPENHCVGFHNSSALIKLVTCSNCGSAFLMHPIKSHHILLKQPLEKSIKCKKTKKKLKALENFDSFQAELNQSLEEIKQAKKNLMDENLHIKDDLDKVYHANKNLIVLIQNLQERCKKSEEENKKLKEKLSSMMDTINKYKSSFEED